MSDDEKKEGKIKLTLHEFAGQWLEFALEAYPEHYNTPNWTVDNFAYYIDKTREETGLKPQEINEVFRFIKNDAFWSTTSRHPQSLLRVNQDDLRKIDNIVLKMNYAKKLLEQKKIDKYYVEEEEKDILDNDEEE